MTVEKIHYEELFPTGVYANQRLRVEIALEHHDFTETTPMGVNQYVGDERRNDIVSEAYKTAKTLVQQAFHAINPNLEEMRGTVITPADPKYTEEQVDKRVAILIQDINNCEVLDEVNGLGVQVGLLGFAKMVSAHPELQKAYDNRLKELSK